MRHRVESLEHPGFTKTLKKPIEDGKNVCVSLGFPYVRNIPPLGAGNQTMKPDGAIIFLHKGTMPKFWFGSGFATMQKMGSLAETSSTYSTNAT